MNDSQLIKELVQAAYDSGYYSGKHEDGQPHHLAAIEERGRLRDAALQRLADLRTMLEELVSAVESCETYGEFNLLIGKTVQQAHAILAKTEKEEIK